MKHRILFIIAVFCILSARGQGIAELTKLMQPQYGNWKLSDSVRTFDQDNLYDYIDGAADNYLTNNFQALLVSTYEWGEKYITVEIYQHQSPDFAFGIYAQERPQKAIFLKAGTQGYQEKGILNFLAGKYYVKLACHDESPETLELLAKMASDLGAKLDSNPGMPKVLSYFPEKNKIQNSENLISMNFLGYEFMRKAWLSSYGTDGKTFRLFIIETPGVEDAKKMISQYMEKTKNAFSGNEGQLTVKDPYNGTILIEWKGTYIWGLLNEKNVNMTDDYMGMIRGNLFAGTN